MKIKNLLFQPVTLHLAGDNEGLHLNAREVKEVLKHQVSREIKLAAARGLVSLIGNVNKQIDHALGVETASSDTAAIPPEAPGSPAEPASDTQSNPKKGNRK